MVLCSFVYGGSKTKPKQRLTTKEESSEPPQHNDKLASPASAPAPPVQNQNYLPSVRQIFGLDHDQQSWKACTCIPALTWLVGENLFRMRHCSFVYKCCCTWTWVCEHCDYACYSSLLGDRFEQAHVETNELFGVKWGFLTYPKNVSWNGQDINFIGMRIVPSWI